MKKRKMDRRFDRYYAAVRYLEALGNISGGYQKANLKSHPRPEMFLERMQDFLDLLGNPENGFKYIHITGTAGKGSVATLVHHALTKSGKKSGLFTSPFVTSTIEKIQIGSRYIDPLAFADIVEYLKPYIDRSMQYGRHGAPSYFELILAVAIVYFKKEKCEYVVLEVGLGGSYDATNIIKKPLVTAITNVGLDHTAILGARRSDIAKDKSGIIKKGSVFFTTENDPKILSIFEKKCGLVCASYNPLDIKGLGYGSCNRLLAGSICSYLKFIEHPDDLPYTDNLPARFEVLENSPLVVIDGAHNPSKIESVIYNLERLKYKRLFLIISISVDKDWKTMLKLIVPKAHMIFVTRFDVAGRQAVNPKYLAQEAQKYIHDVSSIKLYSDPIQAYVAAKQLLKSEDVLLITGSFYLAGDIRSLYCSEEDILKQRNSRIMK